MKINLIESSVENSFDLEIFFLKDLDNCEDKATLEILDF